MASSKVIALKGAIGSDAPGKVSPAGPRYLNPRQFKGLRVSTLTNVLANLERGEVQDWADLAEFMIRDPHVRTVSETRMTAIVGAEIVIEPGAARNEAQAAMAETAAAGFRAELESVDNFESILTHLLHAENVGWACVEHGWVFRDGVWHSEPTLIPNRDMRFQDDWKPQVRTYEDVTTPRWFTPERADRFIFHIPQKLGPPTLSGDFVAIAWHWLSKRWAFLFRNTGLEKFASPFRVGKMPAGAADETRARLETAFKNQSSDHWLVVEDGVDVEIMMVGGDVGPVWTDAIKDMRDEITKCLLGSTLNTEVGSTGGNRALGESQFDTTTLPRLTTMARRAGSTLKCQWAKPWVRFNSHLFGGLIAPTPRVTFKLVADEKKPVSELSILTGTATKDEVREGDGRPAWGAARGGDEIARIQSDTVASGSDPDPLGGEGRPSPLAVSRRSRVVKPSQISFAFRTPIESVPFESSGDLEPSQSEGR